MPSDLASPQQQHDAPQQQQDLQTQQDNAQQQETQHSPQLDAQALTQRQAQATSQPALPYQQMPANTRGGFTHRAIAAAGLETTPEQVLTGGAYQRMITRAATFLARNGPVTQQDRWEEDAGLTPSTLAPVVAALVVAAGHRPEPAAAYAR